MWESDEDELTRQFMSDGKLVLLNLTRTRINSFVKWDLVKFFYFNTPTIDTVENIARYIGREPKVVEPELEELAENGLLEKNVLADKPVYALTSKEPLRTLVDQFVLACEDRFFRIKAVDYIIRGMR